MTLLFQLSNFSIKSLLNDALLDLSSGAFFVSEPNIEILNIKYVLLSINHMFVWICSSDSVTGVMLVLEIGWI